MIDQAESLRRKMNMRRKRELAKTIAIVSGKGGVGKSVVSLNFAIALAQSGKKVLVFDLDIGMGNIELLAGITTEYSIVDFFTNHYRLQDIIARGPMGISIVSGGTGLNETIQLDRRRIDYFIQQLYELLREYDYVIFDIGAGIDDERVHFLGSIDHVFVIVTPEITSIMDAYSAIKYIVLRVPEVKLHLIGNRMKNARENEEVLTRIKKTMQHFLQYEGEIAGYLPEDGHIRTAVKKQIPFLLYKPHSPGARQMNRLVQQFLQNHEQGEDRAKEPESLLWKIKTYLIKRQG